MKFTKNPKISEKMRYYYVVIFPSYEEAKQIVNYALLLGVDINEFLAYKGVEIDINTFPDQMAATIHSGIGWGLTYDSFNKLKDVFPVEEV